MEEFIKEHEQLILILASLAGAIIGALMGVKAALDEVLKR